jgi:MFS family permease
MTPLYAYVPVLYPDEVESKIAITEVAASMGFLIGPVVGSLAYDIGGYITPFIFFGCLALL